MSDNKESLQWGFKRALLHWKMWKEDWTELHARMLNLVEETQVLQRQKEIIYKDSEAELTKLREAIIRFVDISNKIVTDESHEAAFEYSQAFNQLEALAKHKKGGSDE